MLFGGRVTLGMVVAVVLLVAPLGLAVGCIAGYFGGLVDNLTMRLIEFIRSIPTLPLWLLNQETPILIDLEATYSEACRKCLIG